jgi:hypothetical protein
VPEFPTEPSAQIARRLEIRGDGSSSWIVVLAPVVDAESALDGLRNDLSALLLRDTRVLSLETGTFEQLRAGLHQPSGDVIILLAAANPTAVMWSSLDVMRSALEREGPIVFWISVDAFAGLSQFAPNIRSFIGASVFVAGPDGSIMSEEERQNRLEDLSRHYGFNNDEIMRRAESRELPPEPHFVEWLVLLGRGDLL